MINDTICAIATPAGTGAIGIIRISGEDSLKILDKVFEAKAPFEDKMMRHGFIVKGKEQVDEVMAVGFSGKATYTGEPMAELFPHGGKIPMMTVLSCVLDAGARLAEPGEFTKRAFLNGKMDLSEAEAVMDFIGSISKTAARNSFMQLEGSLSEKIGDMQDRLTDMLAGIEAGIEYPEEDLENGIKNQSLPKIDVLMEQGEKLVSSFDSGKFIKEGFNVCIVGKPNVGKSSLLNALIGKEKAIVTDVAGTTRDIIEETFDINGLPVRYFDTAGIHDALDVVEAIGVDRSKKAIENADLILFACDSSQDTDERDDLIYSLIKDKEVLLVLNKADLKRSEISYPIEKNVHTCAIDANGIEQLEKEIYHFAIKNQSTIEGIMITNERHRQVLKSFIDSLKSAKEAFLMNMDLDCVAIDIKDAWNYLGEITGVTVSEAIIDRIFTNFCLGK
jgi:tRNA modification GTPase